MTPYFLALLHGYNNLPLRQKWTCYKNNVKINFKRKDLCPINQDIHEFLIF